MYVLSPHIQTRFRRLINFLNFRVVNASHRRVSKHDASVRNDLWDERMDFKRHWQNCGKIFIQHFCWHDALVLRYRFFCKTSRNSLVRAFIWLFELHSLQKLETDARPPLFGMQSLCPKNGPSLSLDWQLRWLSQLQGIFPFLCVLGVYRYYLCYLTLQILLWVAWWCTRSYSCGRILFLDDQHFWDVDISGSFPIKC